MKKIGLIYNATRSENVKTIEKIDKFLKDKGIETWIGKTAVADHDWGKLKEKLDLAIVLGGDGTLLGASRNLAPREIPIFGINTGHLGFLTENAKDDVLNVVQKILSKDFRTEERAMLCAEILNNGQEKQKPMYALNDVVVSRGTSYRMIRITLKVNGSPVADYVADGLIISTPTGSTAYALSSGGAVMDPEIKGIEIVPICAHSLTSRPHIVSDNKEIEIEFNRPHEGAIIQIDGQETNPVKDKAKIKVTRAKYTAKFLRLLGKESDFYWTIRQKFHWGSTAQ